MKIYNDEKGGECMVGILPTSVGDKVLTILGYVVVGAGIVTTFAGAFFGVPIASGIATTMGGVAMVAKGMEEFINGDVTQGAADVGAGAKATE